MKQTGIISQGGVKFLIKEMNGQEQEIRTLKLISGDTDDFIRWIRPELNKIVIVVQGTFVIEETKKSILLKKL